MKNDVIIINEEIRILDENYTPPKQENSEPIINETGQKVYRVTFHDRSIYRKANVKVYIPSNELSNHNEPHVHVVIDNEYEFVVNIRYITIIKEPKQFKSKLKNSVIELTEHQIQLFRSEWNNANTLLKFVENDQGIFTEKTFKN